MQTIVGPVRFDENGERANVRLVTAQFRGIKDKDQEQFRSLAAAEGLVTEDGDRTRLDVRVGDGDLGRVIGRRGRTAASIRTVTRAAAAKDGVEVDIEFLDD
ncbi:MAG: KH domain-containing protein [Actinobacteria bacterium]|nr:KH domain-containing protein [Actinomycetota bacterium]